MDGENGTRTGQQPLPFRVTSQHASTSAGIWAGSFTDLRHAFRLLWKSKGITATTLLTLGLGIGATTAIFSTVYSLMLKPLPFQEPERIVELYSSAPKAGLHHMPANVPFYLDYSRNGTSYESLGLWTFFYGLVGEKDSVVRIPGVRMTAEIFDILRIKPSTRSSIVATSDSGTSASSSRTISRSGAITALGVAVVRTNRYFAFDSRFNGT